MTFTAPCIPRNRPQRQRRIASVVVELPDGATARARILETLAAATDDEHLDGAAWYPAARDIAELVAQIGGWTVEAGAGIIAAFSPQCSWDENVARALAFARGDDASGLADGLGKAARIAAGAHPLEVLGGRKVRSFYWNIVGCSAHVTVDRHAVAIVYGRPLSDREIKILERCGAYAAIAAFYRATARSVGLEPSTLQAVTWLAWRRLKNVDYVPEVF